MTLTDFNFIDNKPATPDLTIKSLTIESAPIDDEPGLTLQSDFIDAVLTGNYRFSTIYSDLKYAAELIFPAIKSSLDVQPHRNADTAPINNFTYHIDINECENLCRFFNLPLSVIYPTEMDGH